MTNLKLLIDSDYSSEQGKELLLNLVNQKIDFINKALFMEFLYSNKKNKSSEQRVKELKQLKQEIIADFEANPSKKVQVEASLSYRFLED